MCVGITYVQAEYEWDTWEIIKSSQKNAEETDGLNCELSPLRFSPIFTKAAQVVRTIEKLPTEKMMYDYMIAKGHSLDILS